MPKYVVRTGVMRALGVFASSRDEVFSRGAQVIVRSDRGLEAGEVLSEANEQTASQIKGAGQGQILRSMSSDDSHEVSRLHEQERREHETCVRLISEEKLEMR